MFKFSVDSNGDSNSNSIGHSIKSRYSNGRDDNMYGNVYVCSGGGCAAQRETNSVAKTAIGTNAGGSIMIECKDSITIGEGCNIRANGGNTDCFSGCGNILRSKKDCQQW